jgi:hypothetical protein
MMLTIDRSAGHDVVVCNLAGHDAMGMHQDPWITPAASGRLIIPETPRANSSRRDLVAASVPVDQRR